MHEWYRFQHVHEKIHPKFTLAIWGLVKERKVEFLKAKALDI